jgi:chemosensory pili system protein ChpA (sensor histidine kinase/response regulator)
LEEEVGIAQSVDNVSDFKQEELFVGLDSGGIFDMDNKSKTGTQQTEQVLRKPGELVRIPIERLDELVNLVSELVVNSSAFEQHFSRFVQELAELSSSLDRLRRVTSILKTQYEAIMLGGKLPPVYETGKFEAVEMQALNQQTHEFDELEFDRYTEFHQHARELSESTSDIRAVGSQMRDLTGDFYSYLNRQQRITSEVQDKFMRLQMVPLLATVATRLHRTVRVIASQQNKRVQLNIIGEDVELDKTVIEEMSDSLLHIIRNSVDHGVELPEHRKALNKNEVGTISLKAYYEGTQVVIQIGDDGAGLVPEVLRAAAVRGGFVSEADSLRLKKEDLYKLIFLPGFTSATEISEISGRGVGMDIVNNTVRKLKGTISVNSVPAKGVTFNIILPMNLL